MPDPTPARIPAAFAVAEAGPGLYRSKVARSKAALVHLYVPGCADCQVAAPVFKALEADHKGKLQFYQLDASVADNSALLPKDVAVSAYPGFLLLKNGKTASWRSGMPLARGLRPDGSSEADEEYQLRLATWFRAAIRQENLNLPE